jgi:hypothetical protein
VVFHIWGLFAVGKIRGKHKISHMKKKQLSELTTLTPASDEQTIKRVAVPFHPPITNKLQALFKKHQIKMVHSTRGKLGELLGNPKDQVETLQKSGIYQIDYLGCSASYVRQSRRKITTRFNDYHRNIRKIILSFQVLPIM